MLTLILGCGIFGYGEPPADSVPDTALPDTAVSGLTSCDDATFFGNQPDFASPGTVVGRVASPSGHVPVSGARLSVSADGEEAWTVSAEAGCFTLDLPPGTYTLELEKGRYTASRLATVVQGETVDLGELTLDQGDLRLAVVHGKYDSVHLLIDELGIDFDTYTEPEDLFGDLELLNSYDAVFSNCGSTATTQNDAAYTPEQIANARAWVHAGGTLYTSDWEWELFEAVAPDALVFGEDVLSGPDGTLQATIEDRNIQALLGRDTADITFDLPDWALAEENDTATVLVSAEFEGVSRPLAVMAYPGEGRAAFTSFHNESQLNDDMRVVLYELILSLSGEREEAPDPITVEGVVYQFMTHAPLGGAMVTTLQFPDIVALTDSQGRYALEGIPVGAEFTPYTLLQEHVPSAHQTFTAEQDMDLVLVQLVHRDVFGALAGGLGQAGLQIDLENACHVVTTISVPEAGQVADWEEFLQFGDAGRLPDATATISPGAGTQLYFNEQVQPDPSLASSTTDGGVLWVNLEPGRYTLSASHTDHSFPEVVVDCAPGRFINASPPNGLTAL